MATYYESERNMGMANINEEELKKLLVSADFKEESYGNLPIQEMIILKNSAAIMKTKNPEQEKVGVFFEKRESFFLHMILRRIQTMETLFCVFSKATNLPFVYCDPDSCNDQVWLFTEERFAQKQAMVQKQKHIELIVVKMENKQFLTFLTGLFAMGVNAFVLDKGVNAVEIELEKLVKKPDFEAIPKEKRPLQNPELLLTGCYFAQERQLPEEERDKEALHDLEEEMIVNFHRGKVLVPVQVPEGAEKVEPKDMKIPFIKLNNGDIYQPVCADGAEFQRFNRNKMFKAIVMDSSKVKGMMGEQIKGIMLNPVTLRLLIPKQRV